MGNILTLQRKKDNALIDNLTFGYKNGNASNQLDYISDAAGSQNSSSVKEYQNLSTATSGEMAYDANGNLVKDLDRNIITIKYNLLNLPDYIQFGNGNAILNTYDASGQKLRSDYYTCKQSLSEPLSDGEVLEPIYTPTNYNFSGTEYIGNIEYAISKIKGPIRIGMPTLYKDSYTFSRLYNAEGYVENLSSPNYYYYRKDHLGDNREVWLANTNTTVQRTQYYPSGLPWAEGMGSSTQSYKYNGKEFIEMSGYDVTDLGARVLYNAGDFIPTPDPLCEKYYSISPYAYCGGNPVNRFDPDGMDWYTDKDGSYQYNPDLNKDNQSEILKKDQSYVGVTYQVKDENGNVTTDYRKDGSILFSNEKKGYERMIDNTIKTGNEEQGVITNKGVLVLPDYKNSESSSDIKDYKYKSENGNIVDADGNKFNTVATVHTHPEGTGPSTYTVDGYGDLGFASQQTPYKPVYVLQLNGVNQVSLIVAAPNKTNTASGFIYRTYNITANYPPANTTNLQNGRFSLIQYTKSNDFYNLLKIK